MDNKNILTIRIKELLVNQSLAVLATSSEDVPYTSLVGFISNHDISEIYFTTLSNTTKYKNIKKNASASLLIDSRTNTMDDFASSAALTVIGKATSIVTEKTDPAFLNYLIKYPNLKDFVSDPLCVLIKIQVSKYILVERFQETQTLTID